MLTAQRKVPDVTGSGAWSGAKMAQVGENDIFWGKPVEKDMEMKKKDVGHSYTEISPNDTKYD